VFIVFAKSPNAEDQLQAALQGQDSTGTGWRGLSTASASSAWLSLL